MASEEALFSFCFIKPTCLTPRQWNTMGDLLGEHTKPNLVKIKEKKKCDIWTKKLTGRMSDSHQPEMP